jgi:hypothetical protein
VQFMSLGYSLQSMNILAMSLFSACPLYSDLSIDPRRR